MNRRFKGSTARELARSIEKAVHEGQLAPGASLPPIRRLAASVGVSPVTVAAAYRRLHARGILSGHGRRGTRVRPNPSSPATPLDQRPIAEGLIDLATGNPDSLLLPPVAPALARIAARPHLYGEPAINGDLAGFAVSEFAADGIVADSLVIASGALDGIERLLRDHLRPGDHVAVEDPSAPVLLDLVSGSGFTPVAVAVDAEGPRPDALAK